MSRGQGEEAEQVSEGEAKGAQKGSSVSDPLAGFDAFKKRIIVEWWKAASRGDRKGEQMWRRVLALDPQLEAFAQGMESVSEGFEAFRKERGVPKHPTQAQALKLMSDFAASKGVDLVQVLADLGEERRAEQSGE